MLSGSIHGHDSKKILGRGFFFFLISVFFLLKLVSGFFLGTKMHFIICSIYDFEAYKYAINSKKHTTFIKKTYLPLR